MAGFYPKNQAGMTGGKALMSNHDASEFYRQKEGLSIDYEHNRIDF
jgi:hypothetical protein